MMTAICDLGKKSRKGFTLIELLIVVAVIAILAAIAVPQFSAYRKRGYNASANSDLRNIRTIEESIFADFSEYGEGSNANAGAQFLLSGAATNTPAQTITPSPNVYGDAECYRSGGKNVAYTAGAVHAFGESNYGVGSPQTTLYRMIPSASPTTDVSLATDVPAPIDLTTDVFAGTSWIPVE